MMKIQATAVNVNRLIQGLIIFLATCTVLALVLQIQHARSFSVIPALVSALGVSQLEYADALATVFWLWKKSLVMTLIGAAFSWCLIWRRWMGKLWTYVSEQSAFSSSTTTTRSIIFMLAWVFITYPIAVLQTGATSTELAGGLELFSLRGILAVSLSTLVYYKFAKNCHRGVVFATLLATRMVCSLGAFYLSHVALGMSPSLQRNETSEVVFKLAEQTNFPLRNIKILPNSINAFHVHCLFDEYMVIGSKVEKEGLGGVVAHELGHRKHKDSIKLYIFPLLGHFMHSALPSLIIPTLPIIYEAFGFTTEPIIAAVPISGVLGLILENLLAPIQLVFSRRCEYRADQGAIELGYSESLIRYLGKAHWKTFFSTNAFFEFLLLSHPSSLRRIEILQKGKENK